MEEDLSRVQTNNVALGRSWEKAGGDDGFGASSGSGAAQKNLEAYSLSQDRVRVVPSAEGHSLPPTAVVQTAIRLQTQTLRTATPFISRVSQPIGSPQIIKCGTGIIFSHLSVKNFPLPRRSDGAAEDLSLLLLR